MNRAMKRMAVGIVCGLLAGAGTLMAAPIYWVSTSNTGWDRTVNANDTNWNTAADGSGSAGDPASGDVATFSGKTGKANPSLQTTLNFAGVVFTDAGWTVNANGAPTLESGSTGIDSAGSGVNVMKPIVNMKASSAWTVGDGNTLQLDSRLGWGGNNNGNTLTKNGEGTVYVNGGGTASEDHTAVNKLTISAGAFYVNHVANYVRTAGGNSLVSVASGATFGGGGSIQARTSDGTVMPLTTSGAIDPGRNASSTGRLTLSGLSTFYSGSSLLIQLNGTTAGATTSGYDQYVTKGLTLSTTSGASNVSLSPTLGFDPALNDSFTIVNNTSATAAVSGLFKVGTTTLNEGDDFRLTNPTSGRIFVLRLSYVGGTGNDITLKVVAEIRVGTVVLLK